MWFDLARSDLEFTKVAPFRFENEAICFASPERVFQVCTGEGMRAWMKEFRAVRWTTPPPHGLGSQREIELDILTVKETFLAWEPGKRLAFSIDSCTLPLVAQMVEDMQIERLGPNKSRLRYVAYYTPSRVMRVIHPVARVIFGKMFRDATKGIARVSSSAFPSPNPLPKGEGEQRA